MEEVALIKHAGMSLEERAMEISIRLNDQVTYTRHELRKAYRKAKIKKKTIVITPAKYTIINLPDAKAEFLTTK